MRHEHRQFRRVHSHNPGMQVNFIIRLLEMHAAMTEGVFPPLDAEGKELLPEVNEETAMHIAGVLHAYNVMFQDWRSIDTEVARIAEKVIDSAPQNQGE
jgi:hypothetical protein